MYGIIEIGPNGEKWLMPPASTPQAVEGRKVWTFDDADRAARCCVRLSLAATTGMNYDVAVYVAPSVAVA